MKANRYEGSAWNIEFSIPPTEERKWRQNRSALVLADNVIRAADMIEGEFPGAQINSVHKANNNSRFVLVDGLTSTSRDNKSQIENDNGE